MGNCQWRFSEWSSAGNLSCFSRRFSQILPLIAADKTNYFKANSHFCGHLRCIHLRSSAENLSCFPVNGEWIVGEWAMVNGESSVILLLLNYYASSSSTLSVISYPFFSYPLFSYPLFSYPFFSYQLFSSLIQVHSIILARF